jgi:hypothetical protein
MRKAIFFVLNRTGEGESEMTKNDSIIFITFVQIIEYETSV